MAPTRKIIRQPELRSRASTQVAQSFDESRHAQGDEADDQKADVRSRADEARHERPRSIRPDFGDERDAERPLAAHAHRGHEAQHRELHGRLDQRAQPGEERVGEDAEDHGAHAADAVAQPPEHDAAERGAQQEGRDDGAEPGADDAIGVGTGGVQQFTQRRAAGNGEEADLHAVEHPAQKGRHQGHPAAAGIHGLVHANSFTIATPCRSRPTSACVRWRCG
jgi:hypothetical protein